MTILNTKFLNSRPSNKGHYTVLVIFVLGLLLFLGLGVWQWHRGLEKEAILARFAKRQTEPPILLDRSPISCAHFSCDELLYRRATVKGYFDERHSLLLDNQFYQHQVGYGVLTPFIFAPGKAVLVYRGWVPLPQNRAILPQWVPIPGEQTITGILWKPQVPRFNLGNEVSLPNKWPKRIQVLIWETLPSFPYTLLPVGLWQKGSEIEKFGLRAPPLPVVNILPARHYGYAFQWVMIALVFSVLCGVVLCRKKHTSS